MPVALRYMISAHVFIVLTHVIRKHSQFHHNMLSKICHSFISLIDNPA